MPITSNPAITHFTTVRRLRAGPRQIIQKFIYYSILKKSPVKNSEFLSLLYVTTFGVYVFLLPLSIAQYSAVCFLYPHSFLAFLSYQFQRKPLTSLEVLTLGSLHKRSLCWLPPVSTTSVDYRYFVDIRKGTCNLFCVFRKHFNIISNIAA